jgi:putative phage-type endonuclease
MSVAIAQDLPFEVVCRSADRPAWLAARMTGIGASEMSSILGLNKYTSELELFLIKTGQIAAEDEDSEAARWGLELEGKILEAFGKRTGRQVQHTGALLRSKRYPWALCTLDGWQRVPGRARSVPLECKLTGAFGRDWDHGVPEYFMPQVQQQMLVTDSDMASFAVLINGTRLVHADVPRDENMIARIVEAGARFWAAVQGVAGAPLPDGSESAGWALSKLYGDSDPDEVALLDWETVNLSERHDEIVREMKRLKKEDDKIKQTVQQRMGTAEVAILPGERGGWTWKRQKRAAYTVHVEESEFRVMLRKQPKGAR